jgi:hypothetical protein
MELVQFGSFLSVGQIRKFVLHFSKTHSGSGPASLYYILNVINFALLLMPLLLCCTYAM